MSVFDKIASGGTATIWRCTAAGQSLLYKRYDAEYLLGLDSQALDDLVAFPASIAPQDSIRLSELCAWPLAVVMHQGSVSGVLMAPAHEMYYTRRRDRREPRHLASLAVAHPVATEQGREYFQIPVKLARLGQLLLDLRFLHRMQVVVGDLQPKNLLTTGPAAPGMSGPVRILFIDCDSFALRGESTHAGLDPLPYKAPESTLTYSRLGLQFTVRSDLYKFSLIAMRSIAEDLGAFEVSTEHLGRYVTQQDLSQLGTLLDGVGNFGDQALETMARGWRSCIAPDGRIVGRVGHDDGQIHSGTASVVKNAASKGSTTRWWRA